MKGILLKMWAALVGLFVLAMLLPADVKAQVDTEYDLNFIVVGDS